VLTVLAILIVGGIVLALGAVCWAFDRWLNADDGMHPDG
jgi:hypothetical protein